MEPNPTRTQKGGPVPLKQPSSGRRECLSLPGRHSKSKRCLPNFLTFFRKDGDYPGAGLVHGCGPEPLATHPISPGGGDKKGDADDIAVGCHQGDHKPLEKPLHPC